MLIAIGGIADPPTAAQVGKATDAGASAFCEAAVTRVIVRTAVALTVRVLDGSHIASQSFRDLGWCGLSAGGRGPAWGIYVEVYGIRGSFCDANAFREIRLAAIPTLHAIPATLAPYEGNSFTPGDIAFVCAFVTLLRSSNVNLTGGKIICVWTFPSFRGNITIGEIGIGSCSCLYVHRQVGFGGRDTAFPNAGITPFTPIAA